MKRTFFLLLAAICLCGCAEMEGAFSFLKINRSEAPENGDSRCATERSTVWPVGIPFSSTTSRYSFNASFPSGGENHSAF